MQIFFPDIRIYKKSKKALFYCAPSRWDAWETDFISIFPVLFPVSREIRRSNARSALRRQPASPCSDDFHRDVAIKPAVSGDLTTGDESLDTQFGASRGGMPRNLCASSALFPFLGELDWRFSSIRLGERVTGDEEKLPDDKTALHVAKPGLHPA